MNSLCQIFSSNSCKTYYTMGKQVPLILFLYLVTGKRHLHVWINKISHLKKTKADMEWLQLQVSLLMKDALVHIIHVLFNLLDNIKLKSKSVCKSCRQLSRRRFCYECVYIPSITYLSRESLLDVGHQTSVHWKQTDTKFKNAQRSWGEFLKQQ
jgi:hypothetical protein